METNAKEVGELAEGRGSNRLAEERLRGLCREIKRRGIADDPEEQAFFGPFLGICYLLLEGIRLQFRDLTGENIPSTYSKDLTDMYGILEKEGGCLLAEHSAAEKDFLGNEKFNSGLFRLRNLAARLMKMSGGQDAPSEALLIINEAERLSTEKEGFLSGRNVKTILQMADAAVAIYRWFCVYRAAVVTNR